MRILPFLKKSRKDDSVTLAVYTAYAWYAVSLSGENGLRFWKLPDGVIDCLRDGNTLICPTRWQIDHAVELDRLLATADRAVDFEKKCLSQTGRDLLIKPKPLDMDDYITQLEERVIKAELLFQDIALNES